MRYALLLVALCVPVPAAADLTATYRGLYSPVMTIEVASNGDEVFSDGTGPRDSGGKGPFIIKRAGHDFYIGRTLSGLHVTRAEDMAIVLAEQRPKVEPAPDGRFTVELVEKGTATINGRIGTAWFQRLADGQLSPKPYAVVSHDPALAPLGRATEHMLAIVGLMIGERQTPSFGAMRDSLGTGAPLLLDGAELTIVSTSPIPASDFDLPARPEKLKALRRRMMSELAP